MSKFLYKYSEKFVSKWMIFAIDLLICSVAFALASMLRFNFDFRYMEPNLFKYHLFITLLVQSSAFFYFKTYSGIIRHTSLEDAKLLFKATFVSLVELNLLTAFDLGKWENVFSIPHSILFIDFFIALFALVFSRLLIKGVYERMINTFKTNVSVIIYGAGHLGLITKNTLLKDKKKKYEVLCFIDDNPQKNSKTIEGIRVVGREEALRKFIQSPAYMPTDIELIFAIQSITPAQKAVIVDQFLDLGITIKSIPPVKQWINGELSIQQINTIRIEDLLEREPISINNQLVEVFLKNKKILITGAAGSIGSEIVRQVLKHAPQEVVLLDQAESPLYDLETELLRTGGKQVLSLTQLHCEVGDVTNGKQMEHIFRKYGPQVVFHAAAYKHVPLMERNPYNALRVNVLGTKNMADLASVFNVEKFVMVSTDKAVNPTNVMGATKRLAEMYVHGFNGYHGNKTRFIITRFGNVLGSNGSVIPLFKKQIESGGPITVTHPDIIRYFMTIPEACQLVLEAGTMGKGGEVFVFDMGEPVKIIDLAKRMIKLSGTDCKITYTGLRPGEKLFEELLNEQENTLPTYHPKITIAKVISEDFEALRKELVWVHTELPKMDKFRTVRFLKTLVPEYISQNSEFEELDRTVSSTLY
jgi:FlaA1/EpsC-like NDP-sugar epimerase